MKYVKLIIKTINKLVGGWNVVFHYFYKIVNFFLNYSNVGMQTVYYQIQCCFEILFKLQIYLDILQSYNCVIFMSIFQSVELKGLRSSFILTLGGTFMKIASELR